MYLAIVVCNVGVVADDKTEVIAAISDRIVDAVGALECHGCAVVDVCSRVGGQVNKGVVAELCLVFCQTEVVTGNRTDVVTAVELRIGELVPRLCRTCRLKNTIGEIPAGNRHQHCGVGNLVVSGFTVVYQLFYTFCIVP